LECHERDVCTMSAEYALTTLEGREAVTDLHTAGPRGELRSQAMAGRIQSGPAIAKFSPLGSEGGKKGLHVARKNLIRLDVLYTMG
jgi:hypothetical protein